MRILSIFIIILTGWNDSVVKGRKSSEVFPEKKIYLLANAIALDEIDKVRKLGESIDVNKKGKEGITLLWWAILSESKNSYRYLLEKGADPNIITDFDSSVMYYAAGIYRDPFYLELALQHGANPNFYDFESRQTVLMMACGSNLPLRHAQLLMEAGADVNKRNELNESALSKALYLMQYQKANYFIKKGANFDPNVQKVLTIERLLNFSRTSGDPDYTDYKEIMNLIQKYGNKLNPYDKSNPDSRK